MGKQATVKFLDLLLGLFPRHLFRVVNEQADHLGIVDIALPELLRERVVAADLLGQFAQPREADAEALEIAWFLVPVRDAAFVLVFLKQTEKPGPWS
jgi:hypothetical protein